jgi:hypothetical protein
MTSSCPICNGGNKTLIDCLLEEEGVACVSQLFSIPEDVIREHIRHSPELQDDGCGGDEAVEA